MATTGGCRARSIVPCASVSAQPLNHLDVACAGRRRTGTATKRVALCRGPLEECEIACQGNLCRETGAPFARGTLSSQKRSPRFCTSAYQLQHTRRHAWRSIGATTSSTSATSSAGRSPKVGSAIVKTACRATHRLFFFFLTLLPAELRKKEKEMECGVGGGRPSFGRVADARVFRKESGLWCSRVEPKGSNRSRIPRIPTSRRETRGLLSANWTFFRAHTLCPKSRSAPVCPLTLSSRVVQHGQSLFFFPEQDMNVGESESNRPPIPADKRRTVAPGDRGFVATPRDADPRTRALIQGLNDTGGYVTRIFFRPVLQGAQHDSDIGSKAPSALPPPTIRSTTVQWPTRSWPKTPNSQRRVYAVWTPRQDNSGSLDRSHLDGDLSPPTLSAPFFFSLRKTWSLFRDCFAYNVS